MADGGAYFAMNRPRVVHLVYDLIRGGTEGQCAQVVLGLAGLGQDHRVAAFHRRGFYLEAVEEVCGPVYELKIRHLARWSTLVELWRFSKWLRREKIDILHAWDADAAIFGQIAARWAGIKFMTSRRDLGEIYPRWKLVMMRWADRGAIGVVANARAVKAHFVARGLSEAKTRVVPNILDLEGFDAQARQTFSHSDELPEGQRLIVVNRLDPEKNTGLLIEALPLVRQRIPDAVLIVAGVGPEMSKLRERAMALGVVDAVCFLGEVHEVPPLLACAQVGALVPSRNEGLSNTILEYMAAGLPVLATDCGGNRELVQDEVTGRLLPVDASPDGVAVAWVDLLVHADQAKALGGQGREYVERNHDSAQVLKQFAELYRDVMGNKVSGNGSGRCWTGIMARAGRNAETR